jgi:4-carboxymuconolactone decarboxylase
MTSPPVDESAEGSDDSVGSDSSNPSDTARRRGMAKMQEVYGFTLDPDDVEGPYPALTVDHLFGTIWTRPGLEVRDRRLLTIGVLAALDQREELTVEQVREVVIHLTHYVGWPVSTSIDGVAERVIARWRKSGGS